MAETGRRGKVMLDRNRARRPNIVVMVGMPRGGSTTLYHHLRQHPGVALPFRKETFYFSFHHRRGIDWFLGLYRHAKSGQVGFDVSPDYFYDERAIDRILAFDPDTKAILSVREPVSWILSLYKQRAGTDLKMPPFEEFIHQYDLRVGDQAIHLEFSQGLVTRMLEKCRSAFGDNLLLYDFEVFKREPLRVCQAIESFVGLPAHYSAANFDNVRLNASDRRHNARLYSVLTNEKLISLMHRFVPEPLLARAREAYYLAAARSTSAKSRPEHAPENARLAVEVFGEERARLGAFFADHPLQLGSGRPFASLGGDAGTRMIEQ